MKSCSWLDRISSPWRTPPKLKISNTEKPGSNETRYRRIHIPSKTRKAISSVTWHQRRTANLSPRTLRESLGDHYGSRHRYRHVFYLRMHNHMGIPALSHYRCNVTIVDPRSEDQLRHSIPVDQPGRDNTPRLNFTRIGLDVLFNANRP